ncbi:MAG TPA: hypothetical protein VD864_09375 [Nocardioides sp.]|nr:hypothetical protein [Nocardioides sp.]
MDHNRESTTMTEPGEHDVVERFHATNGRFSGYLGLAAAGLAVVLALQSWGGEHPPVVVVAALLGAVLVWASLLRPAVWVTRDHLVMRGMFHTDHLPLGRITTVVIGQVLAVPVAGKRYASPVIAYTARQMLRSSRARDKAPATATDSYQVFVEERILHLAQQHREVHGESEEPVRRTWAWPEIAAVLVLTAALAVAIAL